jgi:hypothetical protein
MWCVAFRTNGPRREQVASPPARESRRVYFFFFFAAFFIAKTFTSLRKVDEMAVSHRMQDVLGCLEGIRADLAKAFVAL